MTADPLRFILWNLLQTDDVIDLEEVYAFDSHRTERVMREASMVKRSDGYWQTTPATAAWYERTWDEIRHAVPSISEGASAIDIAEAALPAEALPAPARTEVSSGRSITESRR